MYGSVHAAALPRVAQTAKGTITVFKISKATRVAALVVAVPTLTLGAAAVAGADTPNPVGATGCNGNVVATANHNSGTTATNSRGPGFYFRDGQVVKGAIEGVRAEACG
jgi:hypothetical protein